MSKKTCAICKQPFKEGELYGTPFPDLLPEPCHKGCLEKNMELAPEEKELLEEFLGDYLGQERMAESMGISREELVQQTKEMLERGSII